MSVYFRPLARLSEMSAVSVQFEHSFSHRLSLQGSPFRLLPYPLARQVEHTQIRLNLLKAVAGNAICIYTKGSTVNWNDVRLH